MEQIIKKIIGSTVHTFVVTGKNLHECVMESQKLSFPDVTKCGLCGSDKLTLGAHLGTDEKGNKVYKYTDIKCNECKGSLTFGQKKEDPDTFYLRRNEANEYDWKAYVEGQPVEKVNIQQIPKQKHHTKPPVHKADKSSEANVKPSGKAINYATKISTAKDMESLNEICGKVKGDSSFTQVDLIYLRNECLRKKQFLQALPMN